MDWGIYIWYSLPFLIFKGEDNRIKMNLDIQLVVVDSVDVK